eukprot:2003857-Pleurochrysis_carterae.AAC.1
MPVSPTIFSAYYGKGGRTGMSNCCDSPTHIFDEHHPLPLPHVAADEVAKIKYIFEARLNMANKSTPIQACLAIKACHGLHLTMHACHGFPYPLFCTCYIMRCAGLA